MVTGNTSYLLKLSVLRVIKCIQICAYVCVCVYTHTYIHTHIHHGSDLNETADVMWQILINSSTLACGFVYECVCIYVRFCVCMCIYVCMYVCSDDLFELMN